MTDAIRAALAAAVPDRDVATVADTGGSANPGNRTVRVRFTDGETAYLKVAVDGDGTRLARAAATVRYAGEQTAVRVPTVLASDAEGDPPYLLTAPLSGSPVVDEWRSGSVDERADFLRGVGRALAGVHAARFDTSGRIVGGDSRELAVETAAWPDLVTDMVDQDGATDGGRFADFPGRAADAVETHRDALALAADGGDRPTPVHLHNDPRPENSFLAAGDVGLIDWEQAMVGDPVLDIVKAEGRFLGRPDIEGRERLREALWDGYRDVGGGLPAGFDRRRAVYRVVTFLGVASGFDEWAPGVDEPIAELAGWVRSAFEERLEQV